MNTRTDIVRQARTWIGTPFHHQARLKGKGCDCLGLIVGVEDELGLKDTGSSQNALASHRWHMERSIRPSYRMQRRKTVLPIIQEKVTPDSIVYTDYFRAYNALNVSKFYHRRIYHSKLFARGKNHINGIKNF